jgi:hypothetical protein
VRPKVPSKAHPGMARWHRRAPKARLELRLVCPGILQAHPGEYKGAPWLGRGPAATPAGHGRPTPKAHAPGAPLGACALGAPWDSAGAPKRRGLREGAPWLGQGSHCQPTPCTRAVQLCSLIAQLSPSAPARQLRQWISTFLLVYLVYKAGTGCGHRQLLQHAATESSMRTAAYAQLVDEASTSERAHRRATSKHRLRALCRGIHWRWQWWESEAASTADVYGASSTIRSTDQPLGADLLPNPDRSRYKH